MLGKIAFHLTRKIKRSLAQGKGSAAYWNASMVATRSFRTKEDSLEHFHWRNAQYPGYLDLMPVSGQDEKVVVDYGCGPGNDLVGFASFSKPSKLYGMDVSETAIGIARERLALHDHPIEFIRLDEAENEIPLPSGSVDYVHSSGVLHHCLHLDKIISEFHRILKPAGKVSVMVYNSASIWYHLYVGYVWKLKWKKNRETSTADAFRMTTDGRECPISRCYGKNEFMDLFSEAGFVPSHSGNSMSLHELGCMEYRLEALADRRLPHEHRDFISNLTFDPRGFPMHKGDVAGINACFTFRKKPEST
jgi:ubiquinone/menaquinone biosynthesis C-methylase UbiE